MSRHHQLRVLALRSRTGTGNIGMSLIVGHTAGGEVGLGLLMDVAAEAGWPAGLLDDES